MDCNKEEATRAKHLAEKKMEIKDFSGALKIAIKAQHLYPELENISQLILVCEVHCSSEKKSYGNDKDWYGILKVEPNADETSIKKQYKKLALVLHPDKNKFSGSTDAFKLIGEAQRVLLDREKRSAHDVRRKAYGNISSPNWTHKQPNRPSNVQQQQHQHQHPWNQGRSGNFTTTRPGGFPFPNAGVNQSTFWTVCPFCSVKYQFHRVGVVNQVIPCQKCKKHFTAFEFNPQGTATATQTHTHTHTHTRVNLKPTEGVKSNFTTKPVFEKKETHKVQKNDGRKRKRRMEESSESSESIDSSESEEEEEEEVKSESEENGVQKNVDKNSNNSDFQFFGEQPRRSSRAKRNVSYKENANDVDVDIDNDDVAPSNDSDHAEKSVEDDTFYKEEVRKNVDDKQSESDDKKSQKKDKQNSNNKGGESENVDDDEEEEIEPKVFECPDPEFSDFDKDRKEGSFQAGQIWACYDTEDAMPRFYAYIKKVNPGFKLQIQWLKPDPVTVDEKKWVNADLPVSCGRFKHGKSDKSEDLFSFSHLVTWETGPKKTINIIPREGETWALFKNWSINWYSPEEDDEERKYEYEFVEILSDFDEDSGARVLLLEKVKGFVCIFSRKGGGEMVISGSEKYRFGHMVPSCRMSGEERDGVPKGSYELDPASLPVSTFE